jgi:phosphoglycolate phosphatase
MQLRAVLFDLDGTLLDTAGDIAVALNRSLVDAGRAAVSAASVRHWVGRGAAALVRRALASRGEAADDAACDALVESFLGHYAGLHATGESTARAYPGVAQALPALRGRGLRLAVVTNKQHSLAVDALAGAGLADWLDLVVGGDTCRRRKPDPEPLEHACRVLGLLPAQAVMVGDSMNDVTAARSAGMPVVCVPYGYREGRQLRELPCDQVVARLDELPALLFAPSTGQAPPGP